MDKKGRYLLNTNSKKIHDTVYADGRCRIRTMKPECVKYFDTLDEALFFPDKDTPLGKPCRFCMNKG